MHRFIIPFFLLIVAIPVQGQLANYPFNTTTEDELNGYHPTTIGSPDFVNNEHIRLDSGEYLILPNSLNAAFDNTESLELRVKFKVEGDWQATADEEARIILSSKNEYDQRVGGFDLAIREWESSLWIIGTYGDGIIYSNGQWSEGKFDFISEIDTGVWYELFVKFIFDDENPYIQYTVNNSVTFSYYDDRLDYEGFRQTIPQQQIGVGADRENTIRYKTWHPSMDLDIDYLTIASPALPGDPTKVKEVLEELISDMNGEISLSSAELETLHGTFSANWDDLSYASNTSTITTYMMTYADVYGAVFETPAPKLSLDELPPLKAIQFQMQQWILDNQYGASTVNDMVGITFKDHELFPGTVSSSATRLTNATFKIDADYQTDPGFYLNDQEFAIRPTGYYVPAGELVTITAPVEAINQGFTIYIGAHKKNVQETWTEFSRFPRISTEYQLTSQTITVANPFGGGIYVTVPDETQLGSLTFQVDGAIKAPYYSTKEGFTTSLSDFEAEVEKAEVPWADMESANFMCTIPQGMAKLVNEPDSVLAIWDRSFDAVNVFLGRPQKRFRGEYLLVDRQAHVKFTSAPAAYPMSLEVNKGPYEALWQAPVDVVQGTDWYDGSASTNFHHIIFHEYGHLHNMPTMLFEQESNVNILSSAVYSMVMGESVEDAFIYSLRQRLNFDEAAIDWLLTPNFYQGNRIGYDTINQVPTGSEMQYQSRGHAKLVDIANLFGWDALGDIMGYYYDYQLANPSWDPYELGDDEFIESASQVMGFNMAPHFEFWGIIPSDDLVTRLSSMPTSDVIKERILHFRRLVPEDNAAFEPWYDAIIDKVDIWQDPRYEYWKVHYDEEWSDQVIARIDAILARYYDLDDADLNHEPIITGLVNPLSIDMNASIELSLADLIVDDPDHTYPDDFTLILSAGQNYTIDGFTITPTLDFTGTLSVPVQVSDGIEESTVFMVEIEVGPVLSVENDLKGLYTLFPNPTQDGVLQIDGPPLKATFSIIDVSGKLKKTGTLQDNQLKINGGAGLYIVKLTTSAGDSIYWRVMKY